MTVRPPKRETVAMRASLLSSTARENVFIFEQPRTSDCLSTLLFLAENSSLSVDFSRQ